MKNTTLTLALLICLLGFRCSKESVVNESPSGKSGSITRFATYKGFMYALNLNEVLTYSLSNPDKPELVHRLSTDYGLETITIYEGVIYLGATDGLYILDISNPAAPYIQSKTVRVELIGTCDPVVVKGDYAYSTIKVVENQCGFISQESMLLVYNVSDKNNPLLVNQYPLLVPNGLGYKDNTLFVCDEGADYVTIFDISNPPALKVSLQGLPITDPVDLIVDGEKMIVSSKTNFVIYDLSDLDNIKKVGEIKK